MADIEKSIWFSKTFKKIKAAHRMVNIVNGARGCGKTFAFKDDAVEDFLAGKGQFVYMRRHDKELSDPKATKLFFPKDLRLKYPEHSFGFKNGVYVIDDKTAGFPFALNCPGAGKSTEYDDVQNVCFDEYIDVKGGYLPEEVKLFNEALITIGRYRDPQFWLIANNLSWNNPYFVRYGIKHPEKGKETIYGKTWSFTIPDNTKYRQFMETTPIGKFLQECDPEHFNYAFGNTVYGYTDEMIAKHTGSSRYMCTLSIQGKDLGVWMDYATGYWYVSPKCDPCAVFRYTIDKDALKKGAKLQVYKGGLFSKFLVAFASDCMYFENLEIYEIILDAMKYLL